MSKPKELGVLQNDDEFSWVALAFSKDKKFGEDLTFPCTNAPNGKKVRIVFNLMEKLMWYPILSAKIY